MDGGQMGTCIDEDSYGLAYRGLDKWLRDSRKMDTYTCTHTHTHDCLIDVYRKRWMYRLMEPRIGGYLSRGCR
jgi:hypothetical protein